MSVGQPSAGISSLLKKQPLILNRSVTFLERLSGPQLGIIRATPSSSLSVENTR